MYPGEWGASEGKMDAFLNTWGSFENVYRELGMRQHISLRHYALSRRVAGSILDVTMIFKFT
jgi:hypothetical protein